MMSHDSGWAAVVICGTPRGPDSRAVRLLDKRALRCPTVCVESTLLKKHVSFFKSAEIDELSRNGIE